MWKFVTPYNVNSWADFCVHVSIISIVVASLCIVVLEVYQFARDASVAEAWLMAHEPYLSSQEYGVRFKPFSEWKPLEHS